MATSFRQPLDDLIECSVCYEVYKEPRTLPCQHSFCLVCCGGFCRDKHPGDDVECPLCREKFILPPNGARGLRKNFVLEKLILHINQPPMSPQTIFDQLTIKSNVQGFCDKHTTRTIDLYCFGCKQAICTSCLTKDHKSHDVRDLEEVTDELRTSLTTGVTDLQKMYDNCKLSLNQIEKNEKEFMTHMQRLETEIIEDAKRLQEIIEQSKSELLDQVSAKKQDRLKEIDNTKQEVRQQMTFVSSLVNYTTELLKNGGAGDVAREANSLEKRTRKLLQSEEDKTSLKQLGIFALAYTPRFTKKSDSGNLIGSILPLRVSTVRSLPEGNVIFGLTVLNKHLYVHQFNQGIAVYDTDTYSERRRLKVPGLGGVADLTSCPHYQCIYISDNENNSIHKVRVTETTGSRDEFTQWSTDDEPYGLSVNSQYNLIVTCDIARKIKVFTSDGNLLQVIELEQSDIVLPWHTIQLTPDKYVVCHGGDYRGVHDPLHRVCIIDGRGKVERSFGGKKGSGDELLSVPVRLAVVNGLIFVVDTDNRRVVMLNERLGYVGTAVDEMSIASGYHPFRIWFDEATSRLYVGEIKWENDEWTTGYVNAYSVISR